MSKPVLKIIGENGNAFAILGAAQRAAKKAEWSKDKIDKIMEEARSGDYDHLLRVMTENFEVE
jgi:hypothetical protein